jgi:SAM-dependent methyltransferase
VTGIAAATRGGSRSRVSGVSVSDDGIRARSRREVLLDVTFDDRRVWSFWLHRDGQQEGRSWFVPWPRALRKYLDGVTRLALLDSATQRVVHAESVTLGSGTGRIAVVSAEGEPLSLDKSLRLVRTFETRSDEHVAPLLDAIESVLKALDAAGADAFLAYGTALGAVREGRLLGHDSDADLGYVSRHTHPVDVIRESFQLQRRLANAGYQVTRYSAAAFKVHVRESDGHDRGLDVFGGFFREGTLHLMGEIAVPFRREWIYPLGTAYLEGRPFPVPADADRFLTATYGPGWRKPDPAFKFTTSRATHRKFDGWFRGSRVGRAHWDRFYSRPGGVPDAVPSSLVRWVETEEKGMRSFVDVGCGRGADVRYLAERGVRAVGLDLVPKSYAGIAHEMADDPTAEFQQLNLLELRQVLPVAAWAARLPERRAVQVRHVLESLTRAGRDNLWRATRMMLAGTDGRVYVEFCVRRGPDGYAKSMGVRKGRRRRTIRAELEAWGAEVLYQEVVRVSGHPRSTRVCRMVARFDTRDRPARDEK